MAGYRLAGGNADDLTANQELFVALVAYEQIKFQARLAGAEIKDSPRRSSKEDRYGELLERRRQMKEMDAEFAGTIEACLNKRL
ncbi:MAG: hypothetical protein WBN94_10720 [Methanothrix sp.]